jgi:hypothetical protein
VGKDLGCSDLYSVEIIDSPAITSSSECYVQVVNKVIHHSIPRL